MREIVLYAVVGVSSLFVLGYSVHMLVGGLVEAETERRIIAGACLAGVAAMAFMAWDVRKRRRTARRSPP